MSISIGDFQNALEARKNRTKEAIESLKKSAIQEAQISGWLGLRIIWLGFCLAISTGLVVRAAVIAL